MKKKGTNMAMVDSAGAGDIISIAGMSSPAIGNTLANTEVFCLSSRISFFCSPCYKGNNSINSLLCCHLFHDCWSEQMGQDFCLVFANFLLFHLCGYHL